MIVFHYDIFILLIGRRYVRLALLQGLRSPLDHIFKITSIPLDFQPYNIPLTLLGPMPAVPKDVIRIYVLIDLSLIHI